MNLVESQESNYGVIITPGEHSLWLPSFPGFKLRLKLTLTWTPGFTGRCLSEAACAPQTGKRKDKSANGICQLAVLLVGGEDAAPLMR